MSRTSTRTSTLVLVRNVHGGDFNHTWIIGPERDEFTAKTKRGARRAFHPLWRFTHRLSRLLLVLLLLRSILPVLLMLVLMCALLTAIVQIVNANGSVKTCRGNLPGGFLRPLRVKVPIRTRWKLRQNAAILRVPNQSPIIFTTRQQQITIVRRPSQGQNPFRVPDKLVRRRDAIPQIPHL